jgi:hypothetical protein
MRRAGICLLVLLTVGVGTAAGCSSGNDASPSTTTAAADGAGAASTTEPTEIVPDAKVTAGLAVVRAAAARVKATLAAEGPDAAKAQAKQMYEAWYTFEATVRQNEQKLYLQMEDGLADIQAGARDNKPERIDRGVKDLEEGATAYLEKHR